MAAFLNNLSVYPHFGRARDDLELGLRSVAKGYFVILYRVTDLQIDIVLIIDGRRDYDRGFKI